MRRDCTHIGNIKAIGGFQVAPFELGVDVQKLLLPLVACLRDWLLVRCRVTRTRVYYHPLFQGHIPHPLAPSPAGEGEDWLSGGHPQPPGIPMRRDCTHIGNIKTIGGFHVAPVELGVDVPKLLSTHGGIGEPEGDRSHPSTGTGLVDYLA